MDLRWLWARTIPDWKQHLEAIVILLVLLLLRGNCLK